MGWVDQVPRAGDLYIGGLHALYQPTGGIQKAGITHVLSVIDFDVFQKRQAADFLQSKGYVHLNITIDDEPNEDLLQHFPAMINFIDNALQSDGKVFVHCAMGKSRSATAVTAYLMQKYGLSRDEALSQLCEGRPVCSPNPGFMEQLLVFQEMSKSSKQEADQIYKDWRANRFLGDFTAWEQRDPRSKL